MNGDNPLYDDQRISASEMMAVLANIKRKISAARIMLKTISRRCKSSVFDRGSINRNRKSGILIIVSAAT